MKAFNIIKNSAGSVTHNESLILILVITPKNINSASPPEESNKIGLNFRPTTRPNAPNISKLAVSTPTFSSPNRLNSFFILGEVKYTIP